MFVKDKMIGIIISKNEVYRYNNHTHRQRSIFVRKKNISRTMSRQLSSIWELCSTNRAAFKHNFIICTLTVFMIENNMCYPIHPVSFFKIFIAMSFLETQYWVIFTLSPIKYVYPNFGKRPLTFSNIVSLLSVIEENI